MIQEAFTFLFVRVFCRLLLFNQVLVDEYVPLQGMVSKLELLEDRDNQHEGTNEPIDNRPYWPEELWNEPKGCLVASELDQ